MTPELLEAHLVDCAVVLVGGKPRKPGQFSHYFVWRTPEIPTNVVTLLRKSDGETETYDPTKTQIIILASYFKTPTSAMEGSVSKFALIRGYWKNQTH